MKRIIFIVFVSFISYSGLAQFPPQYPLEGNDAVHKSDERIIGWATGATLERGWLDISDLSLGKASAGSAENAVGPANASIVSLGDGGWITLSFERPIQNGEGADFVVFENAFADPLDSSMAFLELAFVEVSTDGEYFVRFPAVSNLQTDSQITTTSYSDASLIHNLAGKYLANYGTPFDLEDLKDSIGIDIQEIRYIRIVDVVGSLEDEFSNVDHLGNVINDPWPTAFPSSGFDLDAVGVLHQHPLSVEEGTLSAEEWLLYPNPADDVLHLKSLRTSNEMIQVRIYDISGRQLDGFIFKKETSIDISRYPEGLYFIRLGNETRKIYQAISAYRVFEKAAPRGQLFIFKVGSLKQGLLLQYRISRSEVTGIKIPDNSL
ncbi:MAG: T9SS type A sorting domain-containing protein [Taibaiella sp.]|nr:T9SS type A sorting domain-containing protein [Taibaiella sp.]